VVRVTYRTVLRSAEFRAVLAAHVCAMLAMIVGDVSLTVLVYQRTASPLLAALTFAIGFVPTGLGAILFGGVGRTRPTRDVLVTCELVAGALVGFAVAPEALATPYAAVIGGGTVTIGLLLTGLPVGAVLGELLVGSRVAPAGRVRLVVHHFA
jgi:hypothetical protein